MSGWIKLHRSLITWEWYDDINVKVTFLHLILSANHAPKKWRGMDIGRGQLWTSIGNLAKEIGLSEKQIRNSLKKLERTNEISIKGASKGTMITVCKYDSYQDVKEDKGEQTDKPKAIKGRTRGEQWATNNNDNNDNNEKNEDKHKLIVWIEENASRVQDLENPITNEQAERLVKEFHKDYIKEQFSAMHNFKSLLKNYVDANKTFRGWANRDEHYKKWQEAKGLIRPTFNLSKS